MAKNHGFKDWNSAAACCPKGQSANKVDPNAFPVHAGQSVSGIYLKQPFTATVVAIDEMAHRQYRLDLNLDDSVDVVSFDSFSSHRKRIRATINGAGVSPQKTSDGQPHLTLSL